MSLLKKLIFFVLASIVLNTIVYYGFITNYTGHVFSETNFHSQYDKKVYKYRVLGKFMLLKIHDVLKKKHPERETLPENHILKKLDWNASENFYRAYYLLNTGFLILCALILVIFFHNKIIACDEKEKLSLIFLLICVMSITQFVVVPYDMIAYFFILMASFFSLMYFQKKQIIWLLFSGAIISLATFNRETAALSVSFAASICLVKTGLNKSFFVITGFLFLTFLVPYLGLHFYFGFEPAFVNPWAFLRSNLLDFPNKIGILFWLVFGGLAFGISRDKTHRKAILIFHLFSLPYILTCFFEGILFEMRLYVPLFILSIIISRINPVLLSK